MLTESPRFRSPEQYLPGEVLISHEQIQERLEEMSEEIAKKYKGDKLLVLGVLKGAFRITADLAGMLHDKGLTDLELSFITIRSYPTGTQAVSEPRIIQDMDLNPLDRHVLIVDDVSDTDRTLQVVDQLTRSRGASSVETLTLLDKPARREVDFNPTYTGFTIPNIWVQGYGMDTDELGRAEKNVIVGPYDYH